MANSKLAANEEVLAALVKRAKKLGVTVATAESITGGGVGEAITSISGSSSTYLGGIIAYSDASKVAHLAIPKRILTKHTAVSEEVARLMAENVRAEFKADYGISTTGVAGPGRAYGHRAGTVWIAIASKRETISIQLALGGDRAAIRQAVIESAIAAFARILAP